MRASIRTKIVLVLGLMAGVSLMIAVHAVIGANRVSESVPRLEEAADHARLAERLDGLINLVVMDSRLLYLADTPEKAREASIQLAASVDAIRAADANWLSEVAPETKLDGQAVARALDAFVAARLRLIELGAKGDFAAARAEGDNETARAPRRALSADIETLKTAAAMIQAREAAATEAVLAEVRATVTLIAVACVLLALGLSIVLSVHLIADPICKLTSVMKRLAQGETEVVIPDSARVDEIGDMERALLVLRDTVKRNSDLVNELRSRDATEILLREQAAMGDRVMVFDQTLRSWIGRLAKLIGRLTDAAGTMTAASMRSREGTEAITIASRRAASDADNVAGSAELLSKAVEDIEQRIVDSAALVRQAVDRAKATGDTVDELASFSGRVGTIVQVIGEIAGQTNLLALNATIEAARAGEAGRGFAVVAQEVKTLASQTAKATAEISDQIAAIQRASHASAEALASIQAKIGEVDRNSSAIAVTADQQRSSTRLIASSIRATADHAKDMATLAENLDMASQEGAASASTFVAIVRDIDAEALAMGREVERFFAELKVA